MIRISLLAGRDQGSQGGRLMSAGDPFRKGGQEGFSTVFLTGLGCPYPWGEEGIVTQPTYNDPRGSS